MQSPGKRYFDGDSYLDSLKAAESHLKKHGDIDKPRLARMSRRYAVQLWHVIDPDNAQVSTHRQFRHENRPEYQAKIRGQREARNVS